MTEEPQTTRVPQDPVAFDLLLRRSMCFVFLSGFCGGMSVVGLWYTEAYGTLSVLLALVTLRIAWRGWPWEV